LENEILGSVVLAVLWHVSFIGSGLGNFFIFRFLMWIGVGVWQLIVDFKKCHGDHAVLSSWELATT